MLGILNRPGLRFAVSALMELGSVQLRSAGGGTDSIVEETDQTLADFIGLDTCLAVMQVLYEGLADSKYRPCPLLVKYVEAGWLGRKTGRGFYDYSGDEPVPTR